MHGRTPSAQLTGSPKVAGHSQTPPVELKEFPVNLTQMHNVLERTSNSMKLSTVKLVKNLIEVT